MLVTPTEPPVETRLRMIEEAIVAMRVDLAAMRGRLEAVPTVWVLLALILPLYGILVLGFAGLFYFLLNFVPHK